MAVAIDSDDATINSVNLTVQGSDPTTPASGHAQLYVKSDHVYIRLDDGTVVDVGPVAGSGLATDTLWDAAGDLVVGSGANTAAKLTKGSNNTVLGVNGSGTVAWLGGLQLIERVTVGVGGAASVTLPSAGSIPSTFKTLVLEFLVRLDTTLQTLQLRFNGDTGANYDSVITDFAPGAGSAESFAATSARVGMCAGTAQPANSANPGTITIPHYAGAVFHKVGTAVTGRIGARTTGNMVVETSLFDWRSASAITSVTLLPASGNFIQDCVFTLWGLS